MVLWRSGKRSSGVWRGLPVLVSRKGEEGSMYMHLRIFKKRASISTCARATDYFMLRSVEKKRWKLTYLAIAYIYMHSSQRTPPSTIGTGSRRERARLEKDEFRGNSITSTYLTIHSPKDQFLLPRFVLQYGTSTLRRHSDSASVSGSSSEACQA